jgi:Fic family protein
MIHAIPQLGADDREVIRLIHEQRRHLTYSINRNPVRWTGFLRRNTFARAMQGSNSIEGIEASFDEAVAIIDNERPESVEEEDYAALLGYRNAMTYVLQLHGDPYFVMQPQVIKSLHFIMLSYDMTKLPGQWRNGEIYVVSEKTGETVYKGPDAELVPALMDELVAQIDGADGIDPLVKGAMAHLNLAMIHPFKDGNGRMARALQTLVIARDGILAPTFSSIEEWLGRNTDPYYAILSQLGQGAWHPQNNALPWLRFCLRAHFQQAATLIKRNAEIGRLWAEVSKIIVANRLPERMELAVMDAAFGVRVRNSVYRTEQEISDVVASRDLKKLCELDLLTPVGEKRGRHYIATKKLRELRRETADTRRAADPYQLIQKTSQLPLPGLV